MLKMFKYIAQNPNNISSWFSKIENCGMRVPKTIIVPTGEEVMKALFMDNRVDNYNIIYHFVMDKIMPVLKENNMFFVFMKNGTFSNKFNFGESCKCRASAEEIALHLIEIGYTSLYLGAGGISEVALREFVGSWKYIQDNIPCIYNGMPLRPEFRVFYDFDEGKVLYTVNYWDKEYCQDAISKNATDKIVYNTVYPKIEEFYEKHKEQVAEMVGNATKNVEMTGKWSIDVMYDEESDDYWLIDMAVAEQSAYWVEK